MTTGKAARIPTSKKAANTVEPDELDELDGVPTEVLPKYLPLASRVRSDFPGWFRVKMERVNLSIEAIAIGARISPSAIYRALKNETSMTVANTVRLIRFIESCESADPTPGNDRITKLLTMLNNSPEKIGAIEAFLREGRERHG